MDETRKLAYFCADLKWKDIPENVQTRIKICVLDYIANVYGSLKLKEVKNIAQSLNPGNGCKEATVLGFGFKTDMNHAAFLNGILAESIESQDGLRHGGNHPVSAVTPAAFAVAENRRKSGQEFLEAVIAGYEVANRISASVHPLHTLSGFLPTGTCGTFGAAAAASRLMGLKRDGILSALGIAGYLAPLSMAEILMGGFTAKIVQGGQAASAGITAALLSEARITGAPYILEGSELKGGFTQITVRGDANPGRMTEGLGKSYTIMDMYLKPYASCRHTHGAIQALLEIMSDNEFEPGDVEKIHVFTYPLAVIAVGKGLGENPTFVSAQFSIPYVLAATMLDRELGPLQLTEERRSDPRVARLMEKVQVSPDEKLQEIYPEYTASRVEVSLSDGRRFIRQVDIPKGDPRDPMGESEVRGKMRRFAGENDLEKLDKLGDLVMNLEKLNDISTLVAMI